MTTTTRRFALAAMALMIVFASACGDDETTAPVDPPGSVATESGDPGSNETDTEPAAAPEAEVAAADGPIIKGTWSRQPSDGQSVAAIYGEITNPTDRELVLISASSPVTPRVELHQSSTDEGGMTTMREREDGFAIAPGETLVLEPGGAHVMLLDIDAATYPNEVEVTFAFADTEPMTVMAAIESIGGAPAGGAQDDSIHDGGGRDASDDHQTGDRAGDASGHDGSTDMPLVIDVGPIHELDDELAAGQLAPRRQRAVIAPILDQIGAADTAAGTPEAALLALLRDLDEALADRDLATAAALAREAHDLGHAIEDGTAD